MEDKIRQRNTALEAGLLLANQDVKKLREFISELLPRYSQSKLLTNRQLESFIKNLEDIKFHSVDNALVNQICGALKVSGMSQEADSLMQYVKQMKIASLKSFEVIDYINKIIKENANDFKEKIYAIKDETGGEYGRDYANIDGSK